MNRITLKQNDYGVGRTATLTQNGEPIDLTGKTVRFYFGGHEIKPQTVDEEKGRVLLIFNELHTRRSGLFTGEFKVISDGSRHTVPLEDYVEVNILREKGGL